MKNVSKWPRSLVMATVSTIVASLYLVIILPIIQSVLMCEGGIAHLLASSIGILLFTLALVFIGIAHKKHDLSREAAQLFFVVILVLLIIVVTTVPIACW